MEQIRAGYEALKDIESCINSKDFGKRLVKACDAFYTRIPHCFGLVNLIKVVVVKKNNDNF